MNARSPLQQMPDRKTSLRNFYANGIRVIAFPFLVFLMPEDKGGISTSEECANGYRPGESHLLGVRSTEFSPDPHEAFAFDLRGGGIVPKGMMPQL